MIYSRKCIEKKGNVIHYTVRQTLQQNGVIERMNRTLIEKVCCMFSSCGLGKDYWAETITYACYLVNHLPKSVLKGKTPIEMWTDFSSYDYDSLCMLGV